MNVLLTGAAGLFGVHILNKLIKCQDIDKIYGIDNYSRQYLRTPPFLDTDFDSDKFIFMNGDFRDLSSSQIDEWGIDTVVHLAAFISVPESGRSPELSDAYFMNNEFGTFGLMQTLLQTKRWPVMLFASSGKVYGAPRYMPIDTDHPLHPGNVYGATKLAAEKHCMAMHFERHYPVIAVRNFNTFGPNQNIFTDAAVISSFIEKGLKGDPITVHNDGSQSRDFNYVEDAADAYMALCLEGRSHSGAIFNLCSGKSTSIQELAESILALTGSKSAIVHVPERSVDMMNMSADYSAINRAIGWQPSHSLEEGLRKTVEWYRGVT